MLQGIFTNALCGFMVMLPLMVLWQCIFTSKRERLPFGHMCMGYLFAFSLLGILSATGVPSLGDVSMNFKINTTPFQGNMRNFMQYFLNLVLFVPFGFFLPVLWKKFRFFPFTIVLGFFFSVAIEGAQLFNNRATDIDDVIMNTAGTLVGYLIFAIGRWLFPRGFDKFHCGRTGKSLAPLLGYIMVAWGIIFFAVPFVSGAVWAMM